MISANKMLVSSLLWEESRTPDNFTIFGSHFLIIIVTWRKLQAREGGPCEATPINFSMAKATRLLSLKRARSYFAVRLYNER